MKLPSLIRQYLEALLVAVLLAVFARTFLLQAYRIPTTSMADNLLVGDHLLVNKLIYTSARPLATKLLPLRLPQRGDVVVFRRPQEARRDYIKRCVGTPGDLVEIRDKELSINGQLIDDNGYVVHRDSRVYPPSRFLHERYRFRDNFGPYTVPAGHYFVLGDNRDDSQDSRFWGAIPASSISGRALLVYWSFAARADDSAGATSRARSMSRAASRLLTQTRWQRCFRLVR